LLVVKAEEFEIFFDDAEDIQTMLLERTFLRTFAEA
jgi:hypothetical protein